jgi:OFA family oxalate/formate antiporter-like MFS transporter
MQTFACLGVAYLIVTVAAGWFMRNPPDGWTPEGWTPTEKDLRQKTAKDFTLGEALKTWQWWALWLLLFLNTSAGISLISQEAPLFEELAAITAITAAGMVGIVSIGNAAGRVFWAWVSDTLGRKMTCAVMFILQIFLFWFLPSCHGVVIITIISFVILMCYGGGFGTMPAFTADYFGSKTVGPIYGLMLTAWGFASAFGPLLIAHMRQASGTYVGGLHVISVVMTVSVLLPLVVRPPAPAK